MCGIAGWVDFTGALEGDRPRLERMVGSLRDRGPDAAGHWLDGRAAIGHRRLAVIDLAGGGQPMVDGAEGEAVVLTYSGEVYNFAELRETLRGLGHRFRSASDTEVVLRAYLAWGRRMVDRLVGMYAFAVWDQRRGELLLVRDRLGIKPLFYTAEPGRVAFASEPKALLAGGHVEPVVDADGLRQLFATVRMPGEAVYRDVREVRPGCYVRVSAAGVAESEYWTLASREHADDGPATVARTRALLEEAVGSQLVADVPLCSLLSGGVDSSAVTALAHRHALAAGMPGARSFSVAFDRGRFQPDAMRATADAPFVAMVVEHLGLDHEDVVVDADVLAADRRSAALRARDLPIVGDLDTSLLCLFAAVRRQATVALSGEGADELFGGYLWFHDAAARETDAFPWVAMARSLGRFSMFEPALVDLDVAGYQADAYADALRRVPGVPGESRLERRMRQISHLHLTRFLPSPLERKDRMSMAVGLEVRVPFCDHRLVEYVFNVPWALKTGAGPEKALLREAVGDLLPAPVRDRAKSPYPSVPDPSYHEHLRALAADVLTGGSSPALPLLRRSTARALVAMPADGNPVVRAALERIVGVHEWLEAYAVKLQL
jgi:asparagine synthase (glutamine-hydrolysing)